MKYYPSNSSEGGAFIEKWCDRCKNETWDPKTDEGERCEILTNSFLEDEVKEWVYKNGKPTCLAFINKESVWKNRI